MNILQSLLFEPRKAFAAIGERPRYWFPLLLLVAATLVTTIWYTSIVDIGWATDQQLRHSVFARSLTEDQIAHQVQMAQGRRGLQIGISVVGIGIFLPLVLMIPALYNLLVGKMTGMERSFRQWYAFTCWVSALPVVGGALAGVLVLATSHTSQLGQDALKPLSLNALIFHRSLGEPGFSLFTNIDLFQLAGLVLSLIGVKVWSGRSWLFSVLFVGIPVGLIFGVWALISLR
jgi:hypothetical protein